jgi:hypothetical protein
LQLEKLTVIATWEEFLEVKMAVAMAGLGEEMAAQLAAFPEEG